MSRQPLAPGNLIRLKWNIPSYGDIAVLRGFWAGGEDRKVEVGSLWLVIESGFNAGNGYIFAHCLETETGRRRYMLFPETSEDKLVYLIAQHPTANDR